MFVEEFGQFLSGLGDTVEEEVFSAVISVIAGKTFRTFVAIAVIREDVSFDAIIAQLMTTTGQQLEAIRPTAAKRTTDQLREGPKLGHSSVGDRHCVATDQRFVGAQLKNSLIVCLLWFCAKKPIQCSTVMLTEKSVRHESWQKSSIDNKSRVTLTKA